MKTSHTLVLPASADEVMKIVFQKIPQCIFVLSSRVADKTYANPKFRSKGKTVRGPRWRSIAVEVVGFRSQRLVLVNKCSLLDLVT